MNVLDLFGANAYWAEITAPVVGPKGHVTVWKPTQFYSDKTEAGVRRVHGEAPERVDRHVAVRSAGPAEELCRLRDPQPQLSRHLLAEREVQDSADGPECVPQGGLCLDEAGRGHRRHRPCREPQQRHARDGREVSTGSTRTWSRPISSAPASCFVGSSDLLRNPADDHSLSRFTTRRSRARPTASSSSSRSRVERYRPTPAPEESASGFRAYWALAALVIGLSLGALASELTAAVRAGALGVAGFIGTLWLNALEDDRHPAGRRVARRRHRQERARRRRPGGSPAARCCGSSSSARPRRCSARWRSCC